MFVTEAAPKQGRDGALFIKHLDDLRRRLRRYKKIHVICDNAGFHTSHEVIEYLWEHEGRIEVHLLPSYSPGLQPDRAGVVAPARGDHAEPSVQGPGGITGEGVRLAGARKPVRDRGFGLPEGQGRLTYFPICKFLFRHATVLPLIRDHRPEVRPGFPPVGEALRSPRGPRRRDTFLLRGVDQDAEVTLWLDPSLGYAARRVRLVKHASEADPAVHTMQFDVARFVSRGDRYVPGEATVTLTLGPRPVLSSQIVEKVVDGRRVVTRPLAKDKDGNVYHVAPVRNRFQGDPARDRLRAPLV